MFETQSKVHYRSIAAIVQYIRPTMRLWFLILKHICLLKFSRPHVSISRLRAFYDCGLFVYQNRYPSLNLDYVSQNSLCFDLEVYRNTVSHSNKQVNAMLFMLLFYMWCQTAIFRVIFECFHLPSFNWGLTLPHIQERVIGDLQLLFTSKFFEPHHFLLDKKLIDTLWANSMIIASQILKS